MKSSQPDIYVTKCFQCYTNGNMGSLIKKWLTRGKLFKSEFFCAAKITQNRLKWFKLCVFAFAQQHGSTFRNSEKGSRNYINQDVTMLQLTSQWDKKEAGDMKQRGKKLEID